MKQLLRIDSSYPIDKLLEFCNHAIEDSRPGAENMNPIGWEENKSSFLYLLYGEKRYNGNSNGYIIYLEDDKILCGGGFSDSDIDPRMTHLSSRSYTIPGYRLPRVHGQIHDMSIDISMESGMAGAFSSMNEYNIHHIPRYMQLNDPANHPNYYYENGKHYAKPGVRIHPMTPVDYPITVRGAKQWIAYMMWDKNYETTFLNTVERLRCE